MKLNNVSDEQAKAALELMLSEEILSEEVVEDTIKRCPTPELKRCTDVLHSLLCKDDHDSECMYYQEEQKDQCWAGVEHQAWLDKTREIMLETNLSNEKALKNAIAQVRGVIQRLATIPGGVEMLGVVVKAVELKELAAEVGGK